MKDSTKPPSGAAPAGPRLIAWPAFVKESFAYAGLGFIIGLIVISGSMYLWFFPKTFLTAHALGLGWLCFLFMIFGAFVLPGRGRRRNLTALTLFSASAAFLALIVVYKHFDHNEGPLFRFCLSFALSLTLLCLALDKRPGLSVSLAYLICLPPPLLIGLKFPFSSVSWLNVMIATTMPVGPALCLRALREEICPGGEEPPQLPTWASSYLAARLPVFMLFLAVGNRVFNAGLIFGAALAGEKELPVLSFGRLSGLIYRDLGLEKPEDLSGVRPGGGGF